jgi:hypothetical protein
MAGWKGKELTGAMSTGNMLQDYEILRFSPVRKF